MDAFNSALGFWYGFIFLFVICFCGQAIMQCYFLIKYSGQKHKFIYYFIYLLIANALFFFDFLLPSHINGIIVNLISLSGILTVFLFTCFVLKQNMTSSFIISSLLITANTLVESIITPLFIIILSKFSVSPIFLSVVEGICMLTLNYLYLFFFSTRYQLRTEEKSKNLLLLVLPMIFITIILRTLITVQYPANFENFKKISENSFASNVQFLVFGIIAFICINGLLFSYEKIIKYMQAEKEKSVLAAQFAMQKTYVQEAQLRINSTQRFRHDLNNHLIALSGLINQNETQKAKEYIEKFQETAQSISPSLNTGNTVIDILLSEKFAIAQSLGIEIDYDIVISKNVKIDDFDLCTIFSNIFDNAIKACSELKNDEKRIEINAKAKNCFFIIDVINTYDAGLFPKGQGIGLSSVKIITEKYQGEMEICSDNKKFNISIILPFSK